MLQYTRFRGTDMRWRFSDLWKCCIRTADVEKTMLISNAVEVLAYRPFGEDPIYLVPTCAELVMINARGNGEAIIAYRGSFHRSLPAINRPPRLLLQTHNILD